MRKLVAAVVYNKDKYLILRRKLNWKGWEFVKGEVSKETFRHAVLREVKEELGLGNVGVICKLPAEIIYHHDDIRGHRTSMQVGYLIEFISGKIRLSPEHSGYRWADHKKAHKMLTHMTHKTFLRLANEYLRKQGAEAKKKLMEKLSKKHVTLVRFDGKFISLKYHGVRLRCKAVKRNVQVVADWSRKKDIVYYDKNLDAPGILPTLIHEVIEKYVAQKYSLDIDTEAHRIAQAVEKEFVADKGWIKIQKTVSKAWVKANRQKIGKNTFY